MESELITPSSQVLESLLHACGNRKDKKEDVLSIIKRIYDGGYKLHLTLYNFMLQAHTTSCDLNEFFKIWSILTSSESGPSKKPDKFSYSANFRLLANLPLSEREAQFKGVNFHYSLTPENILKEAQSLWNDLLMNRYRVIEIQPFLINDFLSILAKFAQKKEIEFFFNVQFKELKIAHNEYSYENMFYFYYRTMDIESAVALKQSIVPTQITRKAWDCLIQLATKAKRLDMAVGCVDEMVGLSIKPPNFIRVEKLLISIANAERWDLRDKLTKLCKQPEDCDSFKGGKREIWSMRNDAINTLLSFAYGRPGGESQVRGVYENLKTQITLLPSDEDKVSSGLLTSSIPEYSNLINQNQPKTALLPSQKRLTMNYQARKKNFGKNKNK